MMEHGTDREHPFLTATVTRTPVDNGGQANTIQLVGLGVSNKEQHGMDAGGRSELKVHRTSRPLVGILGDVDGRIVPVAPSPVRIRPAVCKTVGTTLRDSQPSEWGLILQVMGVEVAEAAIPPK